LHFISSVYFFESRTQPLRKNAPTTEKTPIAAAHTYKDRLFRL
jgi:hypothetical protein